ncbi:hypothetical protein H8957_014007 [Semnopithecus entellus]
MDPTRDRHHPPADGCSLPVPASGAARSGAPAKATQGSGGGRSPGAGRAGASHPVPGGQSGSEDPLQHLAREVEAAAAAAPCHFPRAAPYSLRSRMRAPAWGPREQSPSAEGGGPGLQRATGCEAHPRRESSAQERAQREQPPPAPPSRRVDPRGASGRGETPTFAPGSHAAPRSSIPASPVRVRPSADFWGLPSRSHWVPLRLPRPLSRLRRGCTPERGAGRDLRRGDAALPAWAPGFQLLKQVVGERGKGTASRKEQMCLNFSHISKLPSQTRGTGRGAFWKEHHLEEIRT